MRGYLEKVVKIGLVIEQSSSEEQNSRYIWRSQAYDCNLGSQYWIFSVIINLKWIINTCNKEQKENNFYLNTVVKLKSN